MELSACRRRFATVPRHRAEHGKQVRDRKMGLPVQSYLLRALRELEQETAAAEKGKDVLSVKIDSNGL